MTDERDDQILHFLNAATGHVERFRHQKRLRHELPISDEYEAAPVRLARTSRRRSSSCSRFLAEMESLGIKASGRYHDHLLENEISIWLRVSGRGRS